MKNGDIVKRSPDVTQGELRPDQYEVIKKICKRPYGLIQLPTGYGLIKTF